MTNDRITSLRKERGYTQMTLKRLTGIDQSELSKIERGQRQPTLDQLAILAVVFDTNMDYLTGLTDVKPPYPPSEFRISMTNRIMEEVASL